MAEPHVVLNAMSDAQARSALERCCGSSRWVHEMLAARPFVSAAGLHERAREVWSSCERADLLEAFGHHPEIGSDLSKLKERFAPTLGWSSQEQASVASASLEVLEALRAANLAYKARFGFSFIVCATGKSASEMLALLEGRLGNSPQQELAVAGAEQAKITELRLEKLTS